MLTGITTDTLLILLGAGAVAGILAWLVRGMIARRQTIGLIDAWESRVDDLSRKRDGLLTEANKYRATIEAQQAEMHQSEQAVQRSNTSLNSAVEKINSLSKDLFTLRAEREDSKLKLVTFQNALNSVRFKSQELQREFIKSREFYKAELRKAFEKRQALEVSIDNARAEQDSLRNLLTGSRSEQESVNRMLESARNRLAEIDKLERDVIRLEADNAQLNHDAALARQEIESLKRDVTELDELKVQNDEMSAVVKSRESSRRQYEETPNATRVSRASPKSSPRRFVFVSTRSRRTSWSSRSNSKMRSSRRAKKPPPPTIRMPTMTSLPRKSMISSR